MLKRALLLVSLMTSFGCGSGDPASLAWSISDERLVAPFEVAAEDWCTVSEGSYCPYIDETSGQIVYDGSSDSDAAGHGGWYDDFRAIGVDTSEPSRIWPSLLMHELGHAGGCADHLAPGLGIMSDPPKHHVTEADVACIKNAH